MLPPYVNVVILSFMRPDNTYQAGSSTFAGTGLDFSSDPSVIQGAIALLKKQNPGTKVLVAVGGATYTNFGALNAAGVAAFVQDFGLDGADLDYETPDANCRVGADGNPVCDSDAQYIASVKALRAALPTPLMLTAAGWSIGAYGQNAWVNALPQGAYTGVAVAMLRAVGSSLDLVNIMSYDAGPTYDPKQAFDAYRSLYSGQLVLGVEVPPEAWGGHVTSIDEVNSLTNYVMSNGGAGMMLWSLQKQATGGPTAVQISQAVCSDLGLPDCSCDLVCSQ